MGTTAEKLAYLNDTKTAIKDAIVAKGVEVPEGTTFRGYAGLISGISTGLSDEDLAKATATPGDVTAGKTFYAGDRTLKTGTAEKGFVLKQIFTGDLANPGYTFKLNSDTFFIFGTGATALGKYSVYLYYRDGAQQINSYNSSFTAISVSKVSDGYDVLIKCPSGNFNFNQSTNSASPLYIFEG